MKAQAAAAIAAAFWTFPAQATLITLNVTPASTLHAAVILANADTNPLNTYDLRLAPGTYLNDFAEIIRPMTIEGTAGAAATVIKATQPPPNSKGIFTTIASLTVRGLTITGAAIANAYGGNGAAIRDLIGYGGSPKNGTLTVENSVIDGNQEGILTGGSNGGEHVIVSNTAFRNNGNASKNTGQEHGVYINGAATVSIDNSVFCGEVGQGHNIKVRSAATTITNTQSYEGIAGGGCTNPGDASRGVDIPSGGILVMDNVDLFQGPLTGNSAMFEFGAEGLAYAVNRATLTNVDFINTRPNGVGIQWFGGANPCTLTNVSFTGVAVQQAPAGCTLASPTFPPRIAGPVAANALAANAIVLPEPGSLALLVGALLGFGLLRRWRA